jgi:hypothetical protein
MILLIEVQSNMTDIFRKYYLHCHRHPSIIDMFASLLIHHLLPTKSAKIPNSTLFLLVLLVQWMGLISTAVLLLKNMTLHRIGRDFVLKTAWHAAVLICSFCMFSVVGMDQQQMPLSSMMPAKLISPFLLEGTILLMQDLVHVMLFLYPTKEFNTILQSGAEHLSGMISVVNIMSVAHIIT